MEYTFLNNEEKLNGLLNRIKQLEQEHYGNVIYITECDIIGDETSRADFAAKNVGLELRIAGLAEKANSLQSTELEDEPTTSSE